MLNDKTEVESNLKRFRDYVITQSKSNLTRQHRNVTRKLYNSIKGDFKVNKNSFSFIFDMEPYGQFLDQGVKGKTSSAKALNSPFKFGSGTGKKGGLTKGINQWVKRRHFQFRDKEGKFMSYDSTAFLITRSIYNKGMKPSLFFTKPFEKAFKNLPNELIDSFGIDAESFYDFTLKK